MFIFMIVAFVIGYVCIALECLLHIHKTATALLLAVLLWIFFTLGDWSTFPIYNDFLTVRASYPEMSFVYWLTRFPLVKQLGEVSEILFFLLGAMTIVKIVDAYEGFELITNRIRTTKKVFLLWIIGLLTFSISSVLDNLATAIVMVALLRKIIKTKEDRWFFGSIVILAANAGGSWSPIGDVTTIMLWISGKISADTIILNTFLPALVSVIVPFSFFSFTMKGSIACLRTNMKNKQRLPAGIRNTVFFLGVGFLLLVPVFKTITHLPPYMGTFCFSAILWIVTELIQKKQWRSGNNYDLPPVSTILQQVDIPNILFFFGILMAVGVLQLCGQLHLLSNLVGTIPLQEPGKYYFIAIIIGILSSVVDNVPLVSSAIGMYDFPMNHYFWTFLAYTAGTGGSILIIGSAAGVAVMGMEKIDFIWYLKKIAGLAWIGYIVGSGVYILQQVLLQ